MEFDIGNYLDCTPDVQFPRTIDIEQSICTEICGSYQLSVSGRLTLCDYCKKPYKTIAKHRYKLESTNVDDSELSFDTVFCLSENDEKNRYVMQMVSNFQFKDEVFVAYAVCTKKCGNVAFIVDGGSQICDKCGNMMFRTEIRKYVKI